MKKYESIFKKCSKMTFFHFLDKSSFSYINRPIKVINNQNKFFLRLKKNDQKNFLKKKIRDREKKLSFLKMSAK